MKDLLVPGSWLRSPAYLGGYSLTGAVFNAGAWLQPNLLGPPEMSQCCVCPLARKAWKEGGGTLPCRRARGGAGRLGGLEGSSLSSGVRGSSAFQQKYKSSSRNQGKNPPWQRDAKAAARARGGAGITAQGRVSKGRERCVTVPHCTFPGVSPGLPGSAPARVGSRQRLLLSAESSMREIPPEVQLGQAQP